MLKLTLDEIKRQKNYYRIGLRRMTGVLFISLVLNGIFVLAIFFVVIAMPEPRFYSTNSAGFITPLVPLDKPNTSSQYLLESDPQEEIEMKRLGADLE